MDRFGPTLAAASSQAGLLVVVGIALGLCGCAHSGRTASKDHGPASQECLDLSGRWTVDRQHCTKQGTSSLGERAFVPSIDNLTLWRSGTILEIEQRGCAWLGVRSEEPAGSGPRPSWHRALIEIDIEGGTFPYRLKNARPGSPRDGSAWSRKRHRIELDRGGLRFKGKGNGTRYEWQLGPVGSEGLHFRWQRRYRDFPIGFAGHYDEFVCTLPGVGTISSSAWR